MSTRARKFWLIRREGNPWPIATVIRPKFIGSLAVGAVAAGVVDSAALGTAPTANATCASFWGINNGGGCTSTLFSVAIAIGTGATASAGGPFGAALAVGNKAEAGVGLFDIATAFGTNSVANDAGAWSGCCSRPGLASTGRG